MWSRVTLVGERRRIDVVLPSREPVGALMPDILELLGDPVRQPAQLRHLVTATGEVLGGDATLADRAVPDGSVLRLVRADEPLPAPVVHDVPEAVDDTLGGHALRWSPGAADWTAVAAFCLLLLAFGLIVNRAYSGVPVIAGTLAGGVLGLAGGVVFGIVRHTPLATASTLGGGALAAVGAWAAVGDHGWPSWSRWCALAAIAGLVLIALCWSSPLGRGGAVGGVVIVGLAAVWSACESSGLTAAQTGNVLAVVCVVLLSTMLRSALVLSGLTSLDDSRAAGSSVPRADVLTAVAAAHRSLLIATLAVAVAAGTAGMAATAEFGGWSASMTALLALIVASRARVFPLIPQKAALWLAALAMYAAVAYHWAANTSWGAPAGIGMLLAAAVLPVVVVTASPPEHVRAKLRRVTNRLEMVAVMALIPVALGSFGVFTRLLHTF